MAGRGTGTMAADMALLITAGTLRRIKATAMLPHTTAADMGAIMVPGTGVLFVPYTVPHSGCMVFPTSDGKSESVSATRELHLQVAELESALSALQVTLATERAKAIGMCRAINLAQLLGSLGTIGPSTATRARSGIISRS